MPKGVKTTEFWKRFTLLLQSMETFTADEIVYAWKKRWNEEVNRGSIGAVLSYLEQAGVVVKRALHDGEHRATVRRSFAGPANRRWTANNIRELYLNAQRATQRNLASLEQDTEATIKQAVGPRAFQSPVWRLVRAIHVHRHGKTEGTLGKLANVAPASVRSHLAPLLDNGMLETSKDDAILKTKEWSLTACVETLKNGAGSKRAARADHRTLAKAAKVRPIESDHLINNGSIGRQMHRFDRILGILEKLVEVR